MNSFDFPCLKDIPENGMSILVHPWSVCFSAPGGETFKLEIKPGFTTDGASIPRWLWIFCGHPRQAPRIAAALAHDWLYSAKVCSRADADWVYAEVLSYLGVKPWRWIVEYVALRLFGGAAWRGHTTEDKYFARNRGSVVAIKRKE